MATERDEDGQVDSGSDSPAEPMVELTPPDPSDDGGEEPAPAKTAGGVRPNGKPGGRGGNFRELQRNFEDFRTNGVRTAMEEHLSPVRSELRQIAEALAELRGASRAGGGERRREAPTPQGSVRTSIVQQMNGLARESQRTDLSPDRRIQIAEQYAELGTQLREVDNASLRQEILEEVRREQRQNGGGRQNSQTDRIIDMLQDEHPEFFSRGDDYTTRALKSVRAYYDHQVSFEGRTGGMQLWREAALKVRAKLGLGEAPPPERDRRALGSPPAGRGGGGNRNGESQTLRVPARAVSAALNSLSQIPGMTKEKLAHYAAMQDDKMIGE